jgi:hypothetical protein
VVASTTASAGPSIKPAVGVLPADPRTYRSAELAHILHYLSRGLDSAGMI